MIRTSPKTLTVKTVTPTRHGSILIVLSDGFQANGPASLKEGDRVKTSGEGRDRWCELA